MYRTATGVRQVCGNRDGGEAEGEAGDVASRGAAGGHRSVAIAGEEHVRFEGGFLLLQVNPQGIRGSEP